MSKFIKKIILGIFIFSLIGIGFYYKHSLAVQASNNTVTIDDLSQEIQLVNTDIEFIGFYIKFFAKDQSTKNIDFDYSVSSDEKNWSKFTTNNIEINLEDKAKDPKKYDPDFISELISNKIEIENPSKYLQIRINNRESYEKFTVYFISPNSFASRLSRMNSTINSYNFSYLNGVPIVSRAQWNCSVNDPSGYCTNTIWTPEYAPVTHLIIHHTATSNTSNDWTAEVRSIWYFHTYVREWGDIGYNFLIDPNGVIYEGRIGGENVIAGHTLNHNTGTLGISLIGTYSTQDISPAARLSLETLTTALAKRYRFDNLSQPYPDSTNTIKPRLSGHRDWANTECPGNTFYKTLPTLQNKNYYDWKSIYGS